MLLLHMTTTASQAVEAEVLIALQNMPTNVILVGDPQQLSSTVNRYAVYSIYALRICYCCTLVAICTRVLAYAIGAI
jgi:AAA domain